MKYIRITEVKTMNCQFFIFSFSSIFILLCLRAGQLTNTLKERKGKAEKGKNCAFQYPTVKTRMKGILKWAVESATLLVNVTSVPHKQLDQIHFSHRVSPLRLVTQMNRRNMFLTGKKLVPCGKIRALCFFSRFGEQRWA